jgi:hypothetical protein
MSYNTFTQHLNLTDGPWRIQDPQRGIVVDQQDRRIATVPKAGVVPHRERQANVAVISAAPELLGALRAAAYALTTVGYRLTDEYLELIDRASAGAPPLAPVTDVDTVIVATPKTVVDSRPLPQVPDPD